MDDVDLSSTFYHGTKCGADICQLAPSRTGEFGPGVYLTNFRPTAEMYAERADGPSEPTVLEVKTSARHPFVVTKIKWIDMTSRSTPRTVQARLKAKGFDSIIGIALNGHEKQVVVFDPAMTSIVGKEPAATLRRTVASLRAAVASLSAARPISLNTAALRREAERIAEQTVTALSRRSDQDEPLGTLAPRFYVWAGEYHDPALVTVTGKPVGPIDVIVTSQVSESPDIILGGGIGKNRDTGRTALVITLNGRYPVEALLAVLPHKVGDLHQLLLHEFTHLVDKRQSLPSYKKAPTGAVLPKLGETLDEADYYNDPDEVREFMQEIANEVVSVAVKLKPHYDDNWSFKAALGVSATWKEISHYLTEANKKLIMKGVYTAVHDAWAS